MRVPLHPLLTLPLRCRPLPVQLVPSSPAKAAAAGPQCAVLYVSQQLIAVRLHPLLILMFSFNFFCCCSWRPAKAAAAGPQRAVFYVSQQLTAVGCTHYSHSCCLAFLLQLVPSSPAKAAAPAPQRAVFDAPEDITVSTRATQQLIACPLPPVLTLLLLCHPFRCHPFRCSWCAAAIQPRLLRQPRSVPCLMRPRMRTYTPTRLPS
jgi:hypothetical protein